VVISSGDFDGNLYIQNGHPLLIDNHDGISGVHLDAARTVVAIELSTGESIHRVEAPPLRAYLPIIGCPILGFLLPWGTIRILTWVGSGFFVQNRHDRSE
jgi:hypothetical protein